MKTINSLLQTGTQAINQWPAATVLAKLSSNHSVKSERGFSDYNPISLGLLFKDSR